MDNFSVNSTPGGYAASIAGSDSVSSEVGIEAQKSELNNKPNSQIYKANNNNNDNANSAVSNQSINNLAKTINEIIKNKFNPLANMPKRSSDLADKFAHSKGVDQNLVDNLTSKLDNISKEDEAKLQELLSVSSSGRSIRIGKIKNSSLTKAEKKVITADVLQTIRDTVLQVYAKTGDLKLAEATKEKMISTLSDKTLKSSLKDFANGNKDGLLYTMAKEIARLSVDGIHGTLQNHGIEAKIKNNDSFDDQLSQVNRIKNNEQDVKNIEPLKVGKDNKVKNNELIAI